MGLFDTIGDALGIGDRKSRQESREIRRETRETFDFLREEIGIDIGTGSSQSREDARDARYDAQAERYRRQQEAYEERYGGHHHRGGGYGYGRDYGGHGGHHHGSDDRYREYEEKARESEERYHEYKNNRIDTYHQDRSYDTRDPYFDRRSSRDSDYDDVAYNPDADNRHTREDRSEGRSEDASGINNNLSEGEVTAGLLNAGYNAKETVQMAENLEFIYDDIQIFNKNGKIDADKFTEAFERLAIEEMDGDIRALETIDKANRQEIGSNSDLSIRSNNDYGDVVAAMNERVTDKVALLKEEQQVPPREPEDIPEVIVDTVPTSRQPTNEREDIPEIIVDTVPSTQQPTSGRDEDVTIPNEPTRTDAREETLNALAAEKHDRKEVQAALEPEITRKMVAEFSVEERVALRENLRELGDAANYSEAASIEDNLNNYITTLVNRPGTMDNPIRDFLEDAADGKDVEGRVAMNAGEFLKEQIQSDLGNGDPVREMNDNFKQDSRFQEAIAGLNGADIQYSETNDVTLQALAQTNSGKGQLLG